MSGVSALFDRFRSWDIERSLGLRAESPNVAIALEGDRMALVRLRRRKRGRALLETQRIEILDHPSVPGTIFEQAGADDASLSESFRRLFEACRIRPGRVSLVLPDNLAKISLLSLAEWPSSRRQMEEIIRFKMRKSIPFRLEDARMSYQVLPSDSPGVTILVALLRRGLIERYEQALDGIGARVGLIDLCTPNLINLCRARIDEAATAGTDVALINCAPNYFSLAIMRNGNLIFLRCKTFGLGSPDAPAEQDGLLGREVAGSISYYEEKLGGQGIGTLLVRAAEGTTEQYARKLGQLNVPRVEFLDPLAQIDTPASEPLDPDFVQRLAPAIGAALGRG